MKALRKSHPKVGRGRMVVPMCAGPYLFPLGGAKPKQRHFEIAATVFLTKKRT
jgi:hypothetical protein